MSSNSSNNSNAGKVRLLGGGIQGAVSLLNGLTAEESNRILKEIAEKSPDLVEKIRDKMVSIGDLKYLTENMLRDLFQTVSLNVVGLAFRVVDNETKEYVFAHISSGMRQEINDILEGPPQKRTDVNSAKQKIVDVLRDKIKEGKIVIDRSGKEEYV